MGAAASLSLVASMGVEISQYFDSSEGNVDIDLGPYFQGRWRAGLAKRTRRTTDPLYGNPSYAQSGYFIWPEAEKYLAHFAQGTHVNFDCTPASTTDAANKSKMFITIAMKNLFAKPSVAGSVTTTSDPIEVAALLRSFLWYPWNIADPNDPVNTGLSGGVSWFFSNTTLSQINVSNGQYANWSHVRNVSWIDDTPNPPVLFAWGNFGSRVLQQAPTERERTEKWTDWNDPTDYFQYSTGDQVLPFIGKSDPYGWVSIVAGQKSTGALVAVVPPPTSGNSIYYTPRNLAFGSPALFPPQILKKELYNFFKRMCTNNIFASLNTTGCSIHIAIALTLTVSGVSYSMVKYLQEYYVSEGGVAKYPWLAIFGKGLTVSGNWLTLMLDPLTVQDVDLPASGGGPYVQFIQTLQNGLSFPIVFTDIPAQHRTATSFTLTAQYKVGVLGGMIWFDSGPMSQTIRTASVLFNIGHLITNNTPWSLLSWKVLYEDLCGSSVSVPYTTCQAGQTYCGDGSSALASIPGTCSVQTTADFNENLELLKVQVSTFNATMQSVVSLQSSIIQDLSNTIQFLQQYSQYAYSDTLSNLQTQLAELLSLNTKLAVDYAQFTPTASGTVACSEKATLQQLTETRAAVTVSEKKIKAIFTAFQTWLEDNDVNIDSSYGDADFSVRSVLLTVNNTLARLADEAQKAKDAADVVNGGQYAGGSTGGYNNNPFGGFANVPAPESTASSSSGGLDTTTIIIIVVAIVVVLAVFGGAGGRAYYNRQVAAAAPASGPRRVAASA